MGPRTKIDFGLSPEVIHYYDDDDIFNGVIAMFANYIIEISPGRVVEYNCNNIFEEITQLYLYGRTY